MKGYVARHEKGSLHLLVTVCFIIFLLVSVTSLGLVRLYGLYLEHRLAYVSSRISVMSSKNAELGERYSAMLSPARIYNYARTQLGMVTAQEIETIRLQERPNDRVVLASLPERKIEIEGPSMLEFMLFLTGAANAQDQE